MLGLFKNQSLSYIEYLILCTIFKDNCIYDSKNKWGCCKNPKKEKRREN